MPGHTKRTEAFQMEIIELSKKLMERNLGDDDRNRLVVILGRYTTDAKCVINARESEPIFVLRAQDLSAQPALETWINKVKWYDRDVQPVDKIRDAEECLTEFKAYPIHKLPD